ncbi:inner membrane-spanning protein YciB [Alloalcanivorax sp. C16-1]|uniref:inner membrane-spanning protein YciB n=1 Tax=Alloalcanivorax sp. C16-1 TaxID=3390051 RepID=UPI0039709A65
MKQLFDYLPVVVFFGLYFLSGRDIMLATWGIIAATSFQVIAGRLIWKRWHRLHLMVLAITLVFGGLTLLLRDDVFIKWRPSIISFVLAAVLLVGHFLRQRNLLQRLCEKLMISGFGYVVALPRRDWNRLNLAFILYFVGLGALNLYIAYNFSTDFWVNFKLFGFTALQMVFYVGAFLYFYKRMPDADRQRLFHQDKQPPEAPAKKDEDDDAVRDHQ